MKSTNFIYLFFKKPYFFMYYLFLPGHAKGFESEKKNFHL